jgi:nitrate/nitrite-specific signal transduction histidine kinase
MLSPFALLQKPSSSKESDMVPLDAASVEFRGRIDRKLSIVFVSLFVLVLVVGGSSFYLLRSHLLKSDVLSKQSKQIEFVEALGSRLQSFTAEIQMAQLQGRAIPDSLLKSSASDFEKLLTLYEKSGGTRENIQEMQQIIADAERVAARIISRLQNSPGDSRSEVNIRDLEVMEGIQHRIQVFNDRIDVEHESTEERLISETREKMRMTMGFNVVLVLLGTFFLLASRRYFHRAIVLPVRQLAERASEIAKGDLSKTVPVTSTDEIGLLSHAFNLMAEQLKEHEEKLKGLAILEERERLACELHDSLAQDLAFLRLKLIEAEGSLREDTHAEGKHVVKELFQIVDEAYQDLRESIYGLRALALKNNAGIVSVLTDYLHDFSEVRKIPVELKVDHPEAIKFSPQVEIQFVRIIHEALTNIVKHARATKGRITIEADDNNATISIEDDGEGFSQDSVSENGHHFGFETMRDRANSVGGKISINSTPKKGTVVTIRLPLTKKRSNETHSSAIS